jgi:hypothetical protein
MDTFAGPHHLISPGAPTSGVSYGTDDGLLVEFYIKPKAMEARSKEAGYPVYEDRIYTRIVAPGNSKTTWDHETKGITYTYDEQGNVSGYEVSDLETEPAEPNRFPKAWDRFLKKGKKVAEGWDVAEWGAIPRSFAETLKALNIPTVEALASLPDARAADIMGGRKFRDMAKAALDQAAATKLLSQEQERADRQAEENRQLHEQIAVLAAKVEELSREPKGKRAA